MTVMTQETETRGPIDVRPGRSQSKASLFRRLGGFAKLAWKYFLGAILSLGFLSSFLVVGWTYRLARRFALGFWWKASAHSKDGAELGPFLGDDAPGLSGSRGPNWILAEDYLERIRNEQTMPRKLLRGVTGAFGSIVENLRIGFPAVFNTFCLTLPAGVFWLFAWYAGWNNSFHKGYEYAAVGPALGLIGVALFIAAMLYVPLAQARQAVSRSPGAFWDFRVVSRLVIDGAGSSALLAALYALCSLPLLVLFSAPLFFPQIWPELVDASPAEQAAHLGGYYFTVALLLAFPLFVCLKVVAARLYARGVLVALRRGRLNIDALSEFERRVIRRLELDTISDEPRGNVLLRAAGWLGSRLGAIGALGLAAAFWFALVAQIFVGQFFVYEPYRGWLHQALVQLPWISAIPPGLGG